MNPQTVLIKERPEFQIVELLSNESGTDLPTLAERITWKSAGDFAAAVFLMIPSAPLIAISIAAVKLTSRGPSIYSQTRLGQNGTAFKIYKIRSMVVDSEPNGARWASERDPRVTPVGRFLRRSHLDELPQLWNILRGEMSLVGPRPERPEFVGQLKLALPRYGERLNVKPGVTGLAQIQLPPDTDMSSVRRKLECDLRYIEIMGPWLDLRIIACTAMGLVGIPHWIARKILRVPSLDEQNEMVSQVVRATPI